MPCTLAVSRKAGEKPDNDHVRTSIAANPPLVMFGSINERIYLAEARASTAYIPASFPGAAVRRHTGTPFMGYSGAVWLVQEVCNALFDMLFHVIPLAGRLDAVEPTPARASGEIAWDAEAQAAFEAAIAAKPVLTRISAAKALRDAAETEARRTERETVDAATLGSVREKILQE